ncbi:MAG: YkgJ family cysteine cluster protein [Proteobacteria bacterium]|uniref:YkgJ family cysteine cluster protein n=1 Tax=Candidatus Avisuccinivibrio stercorigallinarum TaxID=2840704 RepID=A0A9D9DBY9_9GAMM|nr:YkgJ family cysteine cluster protein [Candidatus Avisuccinivibrio stercorigallinarum]
MTESSNNVSSADFVCSRCGACCSHLECFGEAYADLDDGSGVCRYYDPKSRLCTCYATRPLKCRVKEGYSAYFAGQCSYDEYLQLVSAGCRMLQSLGSKFND